MKRAILAVLALASMSVFIFGCPVECPEDLGHDNPRVGVTGDSIHSGGGCYCGGTDLFVSHVLLDRGLEDYQVVSFAYGGTTLTGAIPLQYEDLKAAYPEVDVVLISGGANDLGNAEKKGKLDESMIQLIEQAMSDYLTVIDNDGRKAVVYRIPYLIYPPPQMTEQNMDNINDAIYELNMAFTTQANGLGFPVFALDAMMDEDPEGYYADWIHPNCFALLEMAKRVAIMIEYLFQ